MNTLDIDHSQIKSGDLVIIQCHVRYWRNHKDKTHGWNMYLLGVKLLVKIPLKIQLLGMNQKQLDIF